MIAGCIIFLALAYFIGNFRGYKQGLKDCDSLWKETLGILDD